VGDARVELQAEVRRPQGDVFALVSTPQGLRRWLDEADIDLRVGGDVRLRLLQAVAIGKVLAVDAPQHVSMTWDWETQPLGSTSVVAFDLIDHGRRTHLTVRHVGFRSEAQRSLHDAMWRHWFSKLVAAARVAEPSARHM
jgi:uncharacterized protein YndB with AHSA1/START domain